MLVMTKDECLDYDITARKSLGGAGGKAWQDGQAVKEKIWVSGGQGRETSQYWGRDGLYPPRSFHVILVALSADQPASERGCLLMVNVAR